MDPLFSAPQQFVHKAAVENTGHVGVQEHVGVAWAGQDLTAPNVSLILAASMGLANDHGSVVANLDGLAICATRN